MPAEVFADEIAAGQDVRPSIAVTRAHINMPEVTEAMRAGRLVPDGDVLTAAGDVRVTKIAIEPVWHLPGVARRFGIPLADLRRALFEHTGGMFPELVTRPDLDVFLPPVGGTTVYLMGDPARLGRPETRIACRIHDECNGSDVFGSDICTCRPYLAQGIEVSIQMAQEGGVGVVVYQPQGRPRPGRGDEVPGLQRPQAPARRRPGRGLLRADRVRRRRAGYALPGTDAGRAALAGHHPDRPAGVYEQPEIRPDHREWHRGRGTRADPGLADPRRRQGGDGCQGRPPATLRRRCRTRRSCIFQRAAAWMNDSARAEWLCSAAAVRERCTGLLDVALDAGLPHMEVDLQRLPACADYTAAVIRRNYPTLDIPHHARWRHFAAGGVGPLGGVPG